MAQVQLTDVVVKTPQFANSVRQRILDALTFVQSGVMVTNETLDAHAKSGDGQNVEMPHYNPIDTSVEPNISSDDPTVESTPQKLTMSKQKAQKLMLNQSWAVMDLVQVMNSGEDPMQVLADQVGDYWSVQISKYLVSCAMGILADNVANDSGSMLVGDGSANIDVPDFIDAQQTMGDRMANLNTVAMHSAIYSSLRKQNLIDFIRDADNNTMFRRYGDLNVVVDDALPVDVTTPATPIYTSVMFGAGAFLYGEGIPKTPFEVDRNPAKGNGEGEELLYSRRHVAIHPNGYNYAGTPAAQSATRAELQAAGSWTRVYDRKRINMAFIQTRAA